MTDDIAGMSVLVSHPLAPDQTVKITYAGKGLPLPSATTGVKPVPVVQESAAGVMAANLLLTTTAAIRKVWQLANVEASTIPCDPGFQYVIRATTEVVGSEKRLRFFLCRVPATPTSVPALADVPIV